MPISFPRSVGHIPSYYATKKSATRGYVADTTTALYPFGYGLSYTTFEYSNLRLQKKVIEPKESVVVYVNIQNTGDYEGEEVVQLYIRDEVSSVVKPLRELRDFRKIRLKPGEMQTVGLELSFEKLALWDAHMQFRVEPGTFTSYIGGSSTNTMSEKIIVK